MRSKQKLVPLSPTVTQVLDEFVGVMKGDDMIDNDAISRLDVRLRAGTVPKPEEIYDALFQHPEGAEA